MPKRESTKQGSQTGLCSYLALVVTKPIILLTKTFCADDKINWFLQSSKWGQFQFPWLYGAHDTFLLFGYCSDEKPIIQRTPKKCQEWSFSLCSKISFDSVGTFWCYPSDALEIFELLRIKRWPASGWMWHQVLFNKSFSGEQNEQITKQLSM